MDITELNKYKREGLIRCQLHPIHPLMIWNYTEITQASKRWDDITTVCRGLITDTDGRIVARSFKKFHNIEEEMHRPTANFKLFEKLDGSLGILFHYNGEWVIASRGSFDSPQSHRANSMLKHCSISDLDREKSHIFEIIYPENRIVVDYAEREELVYLSSFAKDGSGHYDEHRAKLAGFPIATSFDKMDYKTFKELNWENSEGAVVRFSNGDRAKIKFENYLKMHAVVTHLTIKTVWEWFSTGQPMEEFVPKVPDEYFDWLRTSWQDFKSRFREIEVGVVSRFDELKLSGLLENRGEFARRIREDPDKSLLFRLLDGQEVRSAICGRIKPQGIQTFAQIGRKKTVQTVPEEFQKRGRLLILSGISASGKSSWAREYMVSHADSISVSRDGIRSMLWGINGKDYYDHLRMASREELVTEMQHLTISRGLELGRCVIVDDTNLTLQTINKFLKTYRNYDIEFKTFDCDLETAIKRDSSRERTVGAAVIIRQYGKWQHLISHFDFSAQPRQEFQTIPHDDKLPSVYIFDIDGTLAENVTGRSPYDWGSVGDDVVRPMVRNCLVSLKGSGFKIILCSGRDSICRHLTESWLNQNGIEYDALYMRIVGDSRPDYEIKEEFWRDISNNYNIMALFDDRQQVVDHGRELGLDVFQVAITI